MISLKFRKIYDELAGEIISENFEIGSYLPSEPRLSAYYQVSRETIRKALNLLTQEGMIKKIKGKGSIVLGQPITGESNPLVSPQTIKKQKQFPLVENSTGSKDLIIVLFGGEPLLDFPLFKSIIEYCHSIEREVNKRFHFSTTTNGTLINSKIEAFLIKNQVSTMISIDGNEKQHNNNRYFQNKVESYSTIIKKLKIYAKMDYFQLDQHY